MVWGEAPWASGSAPGASWPVSGMWVTSLIGKACLPDRVVVQRGEGAVRRPRAEPGLAHGAAPQPAPTPQGLASPHGKLESLSLDVEGDRSVALIPFLDLERITPGLRKEAPDGTPPLPPPVGSLPPLHSQKVGRWGGGSPAPRTTPWPSQSRGLRRLLGAAGGCGGSPPAPMERAGGPSTPVGFHGNKRERGSLLRCYGDRRCLSRPAACHARPSRD